MQEWKMLKVRVGGSLARRLEQAVALEGVAAAEIVRRGLWAYFQGMPAAVADVESQEGPSEGPQRALFGPSAPPPSSSPPSSPPAPPLTPPSLSPPASGAASPVSPLPPAPLLLFPCVAGRHGEGGETEWPLTAALVAQWEETFPDMDVLGEAKKARAWLLANHRKTYGGMRKFLVRWFLKAQDSGRFLRRAAGASPGAAISGGAGTAGRSLLEVYGFASWEAWEEILRQCFTGTELEGELAKLAAKRARWEARREARSEGKDG